MSIEVLAPVVQAYAKKVDCKYLWARYMTAKLIISKSHKEQYNHAARQFIPFADGKRLDYKVLGEFIEHLHKKYPNRNSYNRVATKVRSFLKWLYDCHYVYVDMSKAVKLLPRPPVINPLWTHQEYEQFKTFLANKPRWQLHLWLWILGYRTGMSLRDCSYLRWRDVHLNNNGPCFIDHYRIKLAHHGANGLCRIPIIPGTDVHDWLLRLKAVEHLNYKRFDGITDFVHQDAPGLFEADANDCGTVQLEFRRLYKQCGIRHKGRSFQNLRNTFISNLVNSGGQHSLICTMTGHKSMRTALMYLQPDRRSLQDTLQNAFDYASGSYSHGDADAARKPTYSDTTTIALPASKPTVLLPPPGAFY
jgi:integrase